MMSDSGYSSEDIVVHHDISGARVATNNNNNNSGRFTHPRPTPSASSHSKNEGRRRRAQEKLKSRSIAPRSKPPRRRSKHLTDVGGNNSSSNNGHGNTHGNGNGGMVSSATSHTRKLKKSNIHRTKGFSSTSLLRSPKRSMQQSNFTDRDSDVSDRDIGGGVGASRSHRKPSALKIKKDAFTNNSNHNTNSNAHSNGKKQLMYATQRHAQTKTNINKNGVESKRVVSRRVRRRSGEAVLRRRSRDRDRSRNRKRNMLRLEADDVLAHSQSHSRIIQPRSRSPSRSRSRIPVRSRSNSRPRRIRNSGTSRMSHPNASDVDDHTDADTDADTNDDDLDMAEQSMDSVYSNNSEGSNPASTSITNYNPNRAYEHNHHNDTKPSTTTSTANTTASDSNERKNNSSNNKASNLIVTDLEAEESDGSSEGSDLDDEDLDHLFGEGGKNNISVSVRVRPLWAKERKGYPQEIVRTMGKNMVIMLNPPSKRRDDFLRMKRSKEKRFVFDNSFDKNSTQHDIFRKTTRPLIPGVLSGFNATVFAYGATGAGKTYTMLGTVKNPGIMVLTLKTMFRKIQQQSEYDYKVTLSYLEVYNENIRDLLAFNKKSEYLDLREDPVKGMTVAGITELIATSAEEILQILHMGNRNRQTESTAANVTSSRSHAVLQVVVERKGRAASVGHITKVGKLSMIDLAGSERASVTKNRGIRMVEGANINRSLLALANCINALGHTGKGHAFVPYRDSKLTRLLKDSLGGNCRTVMITNVSPYVPSFEETQNTLKYADRAKMIKTRATSNEVSVSAHVAQYHDIICNLRDEVSALKSELAEATRLPSLVSSNNRSRQGSVRVSGSHQQHGSQGRLALLSRRGKHHRRRRSNSICMPSIVNARHSPDGDDHNDNDTLALAQSSGHARARNASKLDSISMSADDLQKYSKLRKELEHLMEAQCRVKASVIRVDEQTLECMASLAKKLRLISQYDDANERPTKTERGGGGGERAAKKDDDDSGNHENAHRNGTYSYGDTETQQPLRHEHDSDASVIEAYRTDCSKYRDIIKKNAEDRGKLENQFKAINKALAAALERRKEDTQSLPDKYKTKLDLQISKHSLAIHQLEAQELIVRQKRLLRHKDASMNRLRDQLSSLGLDEGVLNQCQADQDTDIMHFLERLMRERNQERSSIASASASSSLSVFHHSLPSSISLPQLHSHLSHSEKDEIKPADKQRNGHDDADDADDDGVGDNSSRRHRAHHHHGGLNKLLLKNLHRKNKAHSGVLLKKHKSDGKINTNLNIITTNRSTRSSVSIPPASHSHSHPLSKVRSVNDNDDDDGRGNGDISHGHDPEEISGSSNSLLNVSDYHLETEKDMPSMLSTRSSATESVELEFDHHNKSNRSPPDGSRTGGSIIVNAESSVRAAAGASTSTDMRRPLRHLRHLRKKGALVSSGNHHYNTNSKAQKQGPGVSSSRHGDDTRDETDSNRPNDQDNSLSQDKAKLNGGSGDRGLTTRTSGDRNGNSHNNSNSSSVGVGGARLKVTLITPSHTTGHLNNKQLRNLKKLRKKKTTAARNPSSSSASANSSNPSNGNGSSTSTSKNSTSDHFSNIDRSGTAGKNERFKLTKDTVNAHMSTPNLRAQSTKSANKQRRGSKSSINSPSLASSSSSETIGI